MFPHARKLTERGQMRKNTFRCSVIASIAEPTQSEFRAAKIMENRFI